MKKSTLTFIATTALAATTAAWAQTAPTLPPAPGISSGGIAALEGYLGNMYQSIGNFIINQNYQPISHLHQTIATNTQTVSGSSETSALAVPTHNQAQAAPVFPNQAAAKKAQQETTHNLINSLQQFPYAVFQNNQTESAKFLTPAPDSQKYTDYLKDNSLERLTVDPSQNASAQASDTLWGTPIDALASSSAPVCTKNTPGYPGVCQHNSLWVSQPTSLNNDNFDFASLITPAGYSQTQESGAKLFVRYAAQSTQNLTSGLTNLTKLDGNPALLIALKKDPIYQQFTLTMRTLLAIRSISINSLNQLVAERIPMPGLAAAAGFNTKDKATLTSDEQTELKANTASALQVQAYQANHRVQDPKWYNSVQNASPADVQRNILIVLAEIEQQNYEAHLDREHLLAAITASNLQGSMGAISGTLTRKGTELNSEITTVANSLKPKAVQGPTTTPKPPEAAPPPKAMGTTGTTTTATPPASSF